MNPAGADSGLDLAAYFIASLPATIAAIAAFWTAARASRHNREIRAQVSNDHPTNLRDDLDEIRDLVERIGSEVREDRVARRRADEAINQRVTDAVERTEAVIRKHHPEDA